MLPNALPQHSPALGLQQSRTSWTGGFCQLDTRADIPALPIPVGYSVVLLEALPCQCIGKSDPNPNKKLLLIWSSFPVGVLLMHTTLPFTTWGSENVFLLIFFYISPLPLKQLLLANLAWQIPCPLSPEVWPRSGITHCVKILCKHFPIPFRCPAAPGLNQWLRGYSLFISLLDNM